MPEPMTPEAVNINVENLDQEATTQPDTNLESHQEMKKLTKSQKKKFITFALLAVAAGVLTGYGSFKLKNKTAGSQPAQEIVSDTTQINVGDVFGVQDKSVFADNAQGYLEAGGIDGEGSHRLLREGGVSQTVTLTSSVADLDDFVGMEVKVWGETNKAQISGWFMDVGRLEVVNTEAEAPVTDLD